MKIGTIMLAAGKMRVDHEQGIIYRVPILTAGVTKPSGNGTPPFDVDDITLTQLAAAMTSSGKVKSRMTHPELENVDGVNRLVGTFMNATVEGGRVFADFHCGSYAEHLPGQNAKRYLLGVADEDPGAIGVSLVSDTALIEAAPGSQTGMVLRLTEVNAIDWTDDPAGNPCGMLSRFHKPSGTVLAGDPNKASKEQSMLPNQVQMDLLRTFGLADGASVEDVQKFVDGLDDSQKQAFNALADQPAGGEGGGDPGATGVGMAAVDPAADPNADPNKKPVPTAMRSAKIAGVTLTAEQVDERIASASKAERSRVTEITKIALKSTKLGTKWADKHIEDGTEIAEVRRLALATIGEDRTPTVETSRIQVGADLNRDTIFAGVQDAIMLRAGVRQFVKTDERNQVILSATRQPEMRQPHERANDFRGHSILEMGRRFLVSLGCRAADNMQRPQLAQLLMSRTRLQSLLPGVFLAHSTGDFPNILADTMGKVLRQEYALAVPTWQAWARSTTASDYKQQKKLQISEAGDLVEIPEGEEYTYTVLTESKEVWQLAKFGTGLKFTREMLINDDLSVFDRAPRMLGRAARRKEETLGIAVLTANALLGNDSIALFATGHANLTTGALSVASIGAARAALRKQTALGSSDPLELTPSVLLVPEALSVTAQQLISSTVDPSKNNATPNPFANAITVVSSARLDATSPTQWYLFANPSEIDTVEIGFLEGEEAPVVEEEDEFDDDTRKIKIRHNLAAKAIDYRGMVRSSGA